MVTKLDVLTPTKESFVVENNGSESTLNRADEVEDVRDSLLCISSLLTTI
jgi:hypothetical protein